MSSLPTPEVLRRYVDTTVEPPLPAMRLHWGTTPPNSDERLWYLPEDVCLSGPAPERFGVSVRRRGPDSYAVRVLWNRTHLSWANLTRAQLLTSALTPLLNALGTNLWSLLHQPFSVEAALPRKAA
jgi:hypothetical protein